MFHFHRVAAIAPLSLAVLISLLAVASPLPAAEEPALALVGARILPVASAPIEEGALVVRGGKIEAIGKAAEVEIPEGARVISLKGRTVIPGLVDIASSNPLESEPDASFGSATFHDVIDEVDPFDPMASVLLGEGITSLGIAPRVRGASGMLGAVIKLAPGASGGEGAAASVPTFDLLSRRAFLTIELGQVPESLGRASSSTSERLGQYYAARNLLRSAVKYRAQWAKYRKAVVEYNGKAKEWKAAKEKAEKKAEPAKKPAEKTEKKDEKKSPGDEKKTPPPKPPEKKEDGQEFAEDPPKPGPPQPKPAEKAPAKPPEKKKESPKPPSPPRKPKANESLEVLLRVLDGELPVLLTAHRRDDLDYALRLHEEFKIKVAVLGATEGYRQVERLRKAGVRVGISPVLVRERGLRYLHHRESNPAALAAGGVPLAITTREDASLATRFLRWQAVVALRGGLSPELALRAITLEPARLLGVASRIGSLEKGKDADLVVLSGDPLKVDSRVLRVMVNGQFRIQREQEF